MSAESSRYISTHIYKRCKTCPYDLNCPLQQINDQSFETKDDIWKSQSVIFGKAIIRGSEVHCMLRSKKGRMRVSDSPRE
jgi:hypothetical protein